MAAQTTYRRCACGCGASIDDRPMKSLRTRACQREWDELRRKMNRAKSSAVTHVYVSKPFRSSRVRNRVLVGEAPTRRQKPCGVCCGMPWARQPYRFVDEVSDKTVSDESGRCTGCGEPYAPEPPPEREPVIGSSAGIAARASDMHGGPSKLKGSNYKTIVRGGK